MRTVTCHTEGCGNAGHPLDMELDYYDEAAGAWVAVSGVVCGVCGEPITDVVPPLDVPLEPEPKQ